MYNQFSHLLSSVYNKSIIHQIVKVIAPLRLILSPTLQRW